MANTELIKRLTNEQRLREQHTAEHNERMFGLIPNVVDALMDMIQLPSEDIKWVEIDITDDIVIIGMAIRFPANDIPMFVQIFAPSSVEDIDADADVINQLIRVGLPLGLVDQSVMDIIHFFHDLANGIETDQAGDPVDESTLEPSLVDTSFSTSELTLEQTQKLLLFQHHTSDVKH